MLSLSPSSKASSASRSHLAGHNCAPDKLAPQRFVPDRSAPRRSAPAKLAPDANTKPGVVTAAMGISINDLRKNLSDINDHMARECASSEARYGITLDASLITGIDPPPEVELALAAINTAYNQVSSDISLAQASADQKIVQSKRAVEIETLKAQAEVEPLMAMAAQLSDLKKSGPAVLAAYLRNVRLKLFSECRRVIQEASHD